MVETVAFYILSAIMIVSAMLVVVKKNIFVCSLYLAVALSAVAGLFVMLGADFLAATQILLYVGGIMVLVAFVVLLSSIQQTQFESQTNEQWIPSLLGCAGFVLVFLSVLKQFPFPSTPGGERLPTTFFLGHLLLGPMAFPFEAVSLILLAALLGAVLFSRREKPSGSSEGGMKS